MQVILIRWSFGLHPTLKVEIHGLDLFYLLIIILMIEKVMENNQDKVDEYRSGKDKLFGFFVGQVMKDSGGKANPQMVNKILKEKLN